MSFIERLITKSNPRAGSWILAILVLGVIALMWFSYSGSMSTTADSAGVTITYRTFPFLPKNTIQINYADIESVQLFDRAPSMQKTIGFAIGSVKVGSFQGAGLGSFKAYVNHANQPVLFIQTKEQSYMVSPADAGALKQTIDQAKAQ